MPRSDWFGLQLPTLQLPDLALWLQRRPERPRARGLVISGGGSRGSFEIGALKYLYDHTDFHPNAITGTSAGSILAAALAQTADRDEQREVVAGLERVWRGLRQQADMFAPREWYAKVLAVAPDLMEALEPPTPATPPETTAAPERSRLLWRRQRPDRDEADVQREGVPGPDQHLHPLLGFGDERDEIGTSSGWSPQAVMQTFDVLGALGRAGGELPGILHGMERSRAMFRPGRILRELLAPSFFSPERVASSGVALRIAMVCLETGQLRYVREDGVIVQRDGKPLDGAEPVDLVLGILASCSIPTVFTPVPLGDAHYVDGGVRENLPVEACLGQLGAERPVVIVCSPPGVPTEPGAGAANMLAIAGRSTAILSDETLRDEVAFARGTGCRVIEPEVDVHGPMTVEPGLIDINIDYGWMRAQEASTAATTVEVLAHRDVVMARQRAWAVEEELLQLPDGAALLDHPGLVTELTELKFRVRDLVARGEPGGFPDGAREWWLRWERHRDPVLVPEPWLTPEQQEHQRRRREASRSEPPLR